MRDHLAKTDPASPFSGAAKGPSNQPKTRTKGYTRKGQQQKQEQRTPSQPTQPPNGRTQRWGPNEPVILAAHTSDPDPRDAKIEQLTAQLAGIRYDSCPELRHFQRYAGWTSGVLPNYTFLLGPPTRLLLLAPLVE